MNMTRQEVNKFYDTILKSKNISNIRELARHDLFFLLTRVIGRKDIDRDWLFARCFEVQKNPYGYLDLWARDHYKSTIITVGTTIQDILNNPDETNGIFSHTHAIARAFVRQVKRILETCDFLKSLFPDVLYAEPQKESPKWSEKEGLVVKRQSQPKECTVEGWGLVNGQPIGKHFSRMRYDDIVTRESVNTPDQILLTTEMWELSLNLASSGAKFQYVGTRYHANDTYQTILDRQAAIPRIYPATKDGTDTGEPVFLTQSSLLEKRAAMGMYTFACQMLLNPMADKAMGFKREWISYFEPKEEFIETMNRVIIVDPASGKKGSDYTTMVVIGFNGDKKRYFIYGIRDRLNLKARAETLFKLVKKYQPQKVVYEEYGLQADIEFIHLLQEEKNYRFDIEAIGGRISKKDRILALVPHFEKRDFILPVSSPFIDYEGKHQDFTTLFIEDEYTTFPVCKHDDMLDVVARSVSEIGMDFPEAELSLFTQNSSYDPYTRYNPHSMYNSYNL